jgi:hypothetical protein
MQILISGGEHLETRIRRKKDGELPFYPKYTTTVLGAYSVPRWYEAVDSLVISYCPPI